MVTLVINPGSFNTRARLYSGNEIVFDISIDNKKAIDEIMKKISGQQIDKIAYRIVYAPGYKSHMLISDSVIDRLKKFQELDLTHMPFTIKLIEFFRKNIRAKHIACFDSVFHETLDEKARIYAIPTRLTEKYGIRRFGFHGLAHEFLARKTRGKNLITCQLGGGTSVCAIRNGKSIDTSMGFTPLEGVIMGTRSGNVDPTLVSYLAKKEKKSASEIVRILNTESGLKGIAGEEDARILLKRKDRKAKLALDMLVYSVRKQIGAYIAVLGKVDCIVLGGGMSGSSKLVNEIVKGLGVKHLVVETDEQEMMLEISRKF